MQATATEKSRVTLKRHSLEGPASDSKDRRKKRERNPLQPIDQNQKIQSRSVEKGKKPITRSKSKPDGELAIAQELSSTSLDGWKLASSLPGLSEPSVTHGVTSAMEIDEPLKVSTESSSSTSAMLTTTTTSSTGTDMPTLEGGEEKKDSDDSEGEEKPPYKKIEDDEGHPHSQGILSWHDPLNQYTETIYDELRQNELKYRARADYMEQIQKDINHTMRGILVDWLVEVGEEYKLCSQTLFLTVRYIDRLLSVVSVHRTKLQLVGITCMLLASKYEEIYPPSVDDFVYISDNTYSRDEVLRMETVLLNSLKFALTNATTWEFARRFSAACGLDKRTTALVNYMSEAFLQESQYLKFLPSQIGAAAVYLALVTTKQKAWPKKLQRACNYSLDELKEAATALHGTMLRLYQGTCTLKAIKNKYSEPKWHRVALIVPPSELSL